MYQGVEAFDHIANVDNVMICLFDVVVYQYFNDRRIAAKAKGVLYTGAVTLSCLHYRVLTAYRAPKICPST